MYKIIIRGEITPDTELPYHVAHKIEQYLRQFEEADPLPAPLYIDRILAHVSNDSADRRKVTSYVYQCLPRIYLNLSAHKCEQPLRFDSKPYFLYSTFDVSRFIPEICVAFDKYDLPYSLICNTTNTGYRLAKQGIITAQLCLGNYFATSDILNISNKAIIIARAAALGIYNFIATDCQNPIKPELNGIMPPTPDSIVVSASDPKNGIYCRSSADFITEGTSINKL